MRKRSKNGRVRVEAATRSQSAITRAPIAAASQLAGDASDRAALSRLLVNTLAAIGDPSDAKRRRVRDCRYHLQRTGRGELVSLVSDALSSDGGMLARALARAGEGMRDAAHAAVLGFVEAVDEHDVTSSTARAMLVRAALEGTIANAMLARMVAGEAGPDTGKVAAQLSAAARIDALTALQLEREARDAARAWPTPWASRPTMTPTMVQPMPRADVHAATVERPAARTAGPVASGRPEAAEVAEPVIKRILGHAPVGVTQKHYTASAIEGMRKAVALIRLNLTMGEVVELPLRKAVNSDTDQASDAGRRDGQGPKLVAARDVGATSGTVKQPNSWGHVAVGHGGGAGNRIGAAGTRLDA